MRYLQLGTIRRKNMTNMNEMGSADYEASALKYFEQDQFFIGIVWPHYPAPVRSRAGSDAAMRANWEERYRGPFAGKGPQLKVRNVLQLIEMMALVEGHIDLRWLFRTVKSVVDFIAKVHRAYLRGEISAQLLEMAVGAAVRELPQPSRWSSRQRWEDYYFKTEWYLGGGWFLQNDPNGPCWETRRGTVEEVREHLHRGQIARAERRLGHARYQRRLDECVRIVKEGGTLQYREGQEGGYVLYEEDGKEHAVSAKGILHRLGLLEGDKDTYETIYALTPSGDNYGHYDVRDWTPCPVLNNPGPPDVWESLYLNRVSRREGVLSGV